MLLEHLLSVAAFGVFPDAYVLRRVARSAERNENVLALDPRLLDEASRVFERRRTDEGRGRTGDRETIDCRIGKVFDSEIGAVPLHGTCGRNALAHGDGFEAAAPAGKLE